MAEECGAPLLLLVLKAHRAPPPPPGQARSLRFGQVPHSWFTSMKRTNGVKLSRLEGFAILPSGLGSGACCRLSERARSPYGLPRPVNTCGLRPSLVASKDFSISPGLAMLLRQAATPFNRSGSKRVLSCRR